ncbi:histidinol dehydrogenase [Rhodothermus marinus]|uniref:histidinol dehydrogenase n=1 Tax=Rhodothermus marinus TaxID=29549 RepID=UPI0012BA4654|nr:histidinol dehydrogenase [Rhodothermus marinus]BBM68848.1 histidinol dehydrogenase [Rhodothermus marinus]BBM71828.1 histidinol dehydrogenase [Rhodothermus marinus]
MELLPIVSYEQRAERLAALWTRGGTFDPEVERAVQEILQQVQQQGDAALLALTERFDGVRPPSLRVPEAELAAAYETMDPELKAIIAEAVDNIRRFHEHQRRTSWFVEDGDGVVLGQRIVPLERVGLYVPGGRAFYPSSLLMNAIPAQVAGVPELHLVSPPGPSGWPHPLVLATAHFLGIRHVYAVGGAQAVAALAFGTETIPRVDKIVGPGNAYVALAKKMVFGRVDIDAVAGPSEIVVLADDTADPEFVAADLLSQAEHDERASAVLVTPHALLAEAVRARVQRMVAEAPRRTILEASLARYGACIVTPSMTEAYAVVNELAPEHLELIVRDPWAALPHIRHAGAIFLGPFSTEPVGDYFAGPNHVLPTGGTARYASALSVDDFVRSQSIIAYTAERLRRTGPRIMRFAEAEALPAHAQAVAVRLARLAEQAPDSAVRSSA